MNRYNSLIEAEVNYFRMPLMVASSAFVTPEMEQEARKIGFDIIFEGSYTPDHFDMILQIASQRAINFDKIQSKALRDINLQEIILAKCSSDVQRISSEPIKRSPNYIYSLNSQASEGIDFPGLVILNQ